MSTKGFSYPLKFNLFSLGTDEFINNPAIWEEWRGFVPRSSLYYQDPFSSEYLVIPLYSNERLVTYQLRDIHDDNVDTKYKFTKPVYDTHVKTDDRMLPGLQVLCEGSIDCMVLREHGINAWTTLGLKQFKIKRLLEEIEGSKFLYVLDNDKHGNYFSDKLFKFHGMEMKLPYGFKDINEMFVKDKGMFLKYIDSMKRIAMKFK